MSSAAGRASPPRSRRGENPRGTLGPTIAPGNSRARECAAPGDPKEGEAPSSRDTAGLVERCGHGDSQAWDLFVARYHGRLLRLVSKSSSGFTGPGGHPCPNAGDLAQEVYLRLLANDARLLREFRGETEAALVCYLARTVRSVVTDWFRRERSQKRTATLVPLDDAFGVDGGGVRGARNLFGPEAYEAECLLDERQVLKRLRQMLDEALSGSNRDRDASIFQLYAVEGMTAREIAALPEFALTAGNVESIIYRIRERLRLRLKNSSELAV